jgi:hypothetical protein
MSVRLREIVGDWVTASGHEGQFRPPSLSGRCRLDEATLAGMGGKEEDAPRAVVLPNPIRRLKSTQLRPSPSTLPVGPCP